MGAYNPGGAEGLGGKSISQQRARQEGFLYWLAWAAQNGTSLFSTADGQGPWRRVTICGVPAAVLTAIVNGVIADISESNPALEDLLTDARPGRVEPGGPAARHAVRLLRLQQPADRAASGQRRRPPDPRRPPVAAGADAMNKNPPSIGRIAAMVGFTLSVAALLMFLWTAFGGTLPLRPQGYRFKAAFPEASLLVKEADVRMAGVNIGKVKTKELGEGGRTTLVEMEIDHRFAPIGRDAHAILRQKSLLGETYVEITPGSPDATDLADGGTLPQSQVDDTVQLDEVFRVFDPETRGHSSSGCTRRGIVTAGLRARLQRLARQRGAVLQGGADLLRPLAEQEVALRRVFRDTGRVFNAVSREDGQLRGLITNGDATFGALASRDDALAETFEIFPTFLRETRSTVRRLEAFARNTDPLVRDLREPAQTSRRRCATSATSRRTSRRCSSTSPRSCGRRRPACPRPPAS